LSPGVGFTELPNMACVATAVATAAVGVGVHEEALSGAFSVNQVDKRRKGHPGVKGDGNMDDAVRDGEVAAATNAAANAGDLSKAAHVGTHRLNWEIQGDAGDPHGGDGVGGQPTVDRDAPKGGPGDAGGQASEHGSGNLGGGKGDAEEAGAGVGEDAGDVVDAQVEIVEKEVLHIIGGELGAGIMQVNKNIPACKLRNVVCYRRPGRGA
jgi:hypothetical protein